MLLWADTDKSRTDWIDAFEYIRTEFEVESGKKIEDMLKPTSKNDFTVNLSKSLIPYSTDNIEKVRGAMIQH